MWKLAKTICNLDNIYPYLMLFLLHVACSYHQRFKSIDVRLIEVLDGDTVKVRFKGKEEKIRLLYIDAPELGQLGGDSRKCQDIGKLSKNILEKLLSENLILYWRERDRYGRILGVLKNKVNINLQMINDGGAVIYWFAKFRNLEHKRLYFQSQDLAKKRKIGIWETSKFYDPYKYRKKIRKKASLRRQCSENHFL